jgi:hypothetical protein
VSGVIAVAERLQQLCTSAGPSYRFKSIASPVIIGAEAFQQSRTFARANACINRTAPQAALIANSHTTPLPATHSVNGAFLASKKPLTLESAWAPRPYNVGYFG